MVRIVAAISIKPDYVFSRELLDEFFGLAFDLLGRSEDVELWRCGPYAYLEAQLLFMLFMQFHKVSDRAGLHVKNFYMGEPNL